MAVDFNTWQNEICKLFRNEIQITKHSTIPEHFTVLHVIKHKIHTYTSHFQYSEIKIVIFFSSFANDKK